jgi:hypothetical protein
VWLRSAVPSLPPFRYLFPATFSAATDAADSQVIMQGDPPRNEGDQLL